MTWNYMPDLPMHKWTIWQTGGGCQAWHLRTEDEEYHVTSPWGSSLPDLEVDDEVTPDVYGWIGVYPGPAGTDCETQEPKRMIFCAWGDEALKINMCHNRLFYNASTLEEFTLEIRHRAQELLDFNISRDHHGPIPTGFMVNHPSAVTLQNKE